MHASIAEKNKLIIYNSMRVCHFTPVLYGVHLRDRIAMICILFDLQLWLLEKAETNKRLLTYPFSIKQYNLNCNA
ncbi:hypothetical protein T4B_10547 [Trichinella pseudospiralis]|uniref:Uncharacterized protein n=1 Tax=Trichinella pseudospiralis TaxID=6337 RepID=A0A0V1ISI8_TRIPS|nr:hypothetical protein T4B_10547 [Trichinella pseudospiralis]KRZ39333.1 hypothetical protein T4C_12659 [Trichinella pseudospiralis]